MLVSDNFKIKKYSTDVTVIRLYVITYTFSFCTFFILSVCTDTFLSLSARLFIYKKKNYATLTTKQPNGGGKGQKNE